MCGPLWQSNHSASLPADMLKVLNRKFGTHRRPLAVDIKASDFLCTLLLYILLIDRVLSLKKLRNIDLS